MASFPPPSQIAGSHIGVYEAYYKQADPNNTGSIGALDAATFLKKSGLKDTVLSQVWDLSDPTGKGYLEQIGFYVALKLIALSQSGQEPSTSKLTTETSAPNLGPVEVSTEPAPQNPSQSIPWIVTATEKQKYDQVFDSLQPVNGLLSGDKVKPVLMNSKLPTDVLGRIWDLSDIDKDGFLDRDEFAVAMHFVYKALEKEPVPTTLPLKLVPPSKRKSVPLPGAVPVLPGTVGRSNSPVTNVPWIVTPTEKANYDVMFQKADLDMDGFVSGQEIRNIFLQSGLSNAVLAHIWNLCDTKSMGKLNSEQFALAMHLVQQKVKGIEPPTTLPTEMIPPSLRPRSNTDPTAFGVMDGTNAGPYSHVADFSAIKELGSISKDIDDIKRQKLQLEREKAQSEADIKISQGEVQTLQKELESITATLHQLENQKKEAQKRLDALDEKKSELEVSVKEMKEKCEMEQKQIDDLKQQMNNQAKSVKDQEEELNHLRVDLNNLREEETQLETNVETGKQQLDSLVKSQKELQLQVNQSKARVQHLEDQQRGLKHSIGSYNSQLNGEVSSILSGVPFDDQLSTRATMGSPGSTISSFSIGSALDDFKDDPFKGKDPFGGDSSSQADPFQNEDPFKSDPFKSEGGGFGSDPFASDDPFKDAFGTEGKGGSTAKDDPFGGSDPFGGKSFQNKPSSDPFDPFGGGGSSGNKSSKPQVGNLFESDPFAPKSSSKTESPTPVLPPKQRKQPPPRPAPPKSRPSPSPSPSKPPADSFGASFSSDPFANADPFASSTSSTGNAGDAFANFADFSPSKFDGPSSGNDSWEDAGQKLTFNTSNASSASGEVTQLTLLNNLSDTDA